MERGDFPYDTIVRVAEKRERDLIMMPSHGRKGIEALLLGSETQKVLTYAWRIGWINYEIRQRNGRTLDYDSSERPNTVYLNSSKRERPGAMHPRPGEGKAAFYFLDLAAFLRMALSFASSPSIMP
jgi:hypothetical protein